MASETLSVPEEKLWEVIQVIRAGMDAKLPGISGETKKRLKQWCNDEEAYLRRTGQLIVMAVTVPEPPPKKKRMSRADVARFYNAEVLPKKREEYVANCKEVGHEPDPEFALPEMKASDLDLLKVWECTASPTKFCVYAWGHHDENCIFCGQPEERK